MPKPLIEVCIGSESTSHAFSKSCSKLEEFISNFKAKKVSEGFSYNSGSNKEWESVESLRKLIVEHIDPNFKP